MRVTLKVWRQVDRKARGAFETHTLDSVSPDSSFLEMMDQLNGLVFWRGRMVALEFPAGNHAATGIQTHSHQIRLHRHGLLERLDVSR